MDEPENTQPHEAEKAAAQDSTEQLLGHVGVEAAGPELAPILPKNLVIEGLEPAHYAPAGAQPYEGQAMQGIRITESPEQINKAINYASTVFPGTRFTGINHGRYGIVLSDGEGKAFKVYRWGAQAYSRYEREAGALKLLSDAGVAPKMHLFVDAGREYRLDLKAHDYNTSGFENVQIPRQDSGRELPILIMDEVDTAPLESATPAKLVDGFCKITELFLANNIEAWDTEPVVDRKTGNVIILDVGEISQNPFDKATASPAAKLEHELNLLRTATLDFGLMHREHEIQAAYREGGLASVRNFLTQSLQ